MSTNGNQPNGKSTGSGSDQYATYQTQQYINKIKSRLSIAQSQLNKYTSELSLAQNQKTNITQEFNRAKKFLSQTTANLKEGQTALSKVDALKDFFSSRRGTTEVMVGVAKKMALKIYEATRFVGLEGIQRIENIESLAKGANNTEKSNPDQQYTSLFIQAIEDSNVKGVAALKAAAKASNQSFEALKTNLLINYRTHMFYNQFTDYQNQLQTIVNRLTKENGLANGQYIKLEGQLNVIDVQVEHLTIKEEEFSFMVDQLNAEYLAAQQGADYSASGAHSPAS